MQRSGFSVILAGGSEELRVDFLAAQSLLPHWNVLGVFEKGDKLVSFLSGSRSYSNRREYPLPELLLLDLALPKKSGLEVLAWMQTQERSRIAVVVLGDSPRRRDIREALELGADFYQLKPRTADDFVSLLRAVEPFLLRRRSG